MLKGVSHGRSLVEDILAFMFRIMIVFGTCARACVCMCVEELRKEMRAELK